MNAEQFVFWFKGYAAGIGTPDAYQWETIMKNLSVATEHDPCMDLVKAIGLERHMRQGGGTGGGGAIDDPMFYR